MKIISKLHIALQCHSVHVYVYSVRFEMIGIEIYSKACGIDIECDFKVNFFFIFH